MNAVTTPSLAANTRCAIQPLTLENFASLVRSGSATRVYIREYTDTDGGGWFVDVDHCDSRRTTKLHTERGSLRVFRTADAAIEAVKEAGFSRPIVQSSASQSGGAVSMTDKLDTCAWPLERMQAAAAAWRYATDPATTAAALIDGLALAVDDVQHGVGTDTARATVSAIAGELAKRHGTAPAE